MPVGAVIVALLSAFCFGLAAALQQRAALEVSAIGIADPRLLWRLAHRPVWLVGVLSDGLSAVLHVVALTLGSVTLVQPLGVTGLLFAIPVVAVMRRQPVPPADLAAAAVVLAGLVVFLRQLPEQPSGAGAGTVSSAVALLATLGGTLGAAVVTVGLAQLRPGRWRAVLLAAGAGAAFGMVAVFARALVVTLGDPAVGLAVQVGAAAAIGLLIPVGYLQLQNAYRSGHFAASLATAVVVDPIAALIGAAPVLHEPLPGVGDGLLVMLAAAVVVVAGIAVLVRSPAHLLAAVAAAPMPQIDPDSPGHMPH